MAEDNQKFSTQVSDWLSRKGPKTLGQLEQHFGEKSFAVAFVLLMALSALPLPTGGITNVLDVATILLSIELILGFRSIWLPKWAKNIRLGHVITAKALPRFIRFIRWFEKYSRPRFGKPLREREFLRLAGLIVLVFALGAFLAPPFSGLDTLPALGVVIVSLAIILEDMALFIAGCITGLAGTVLMLSVGSFVLHFFQNSLF